MKIGLFITARLGSTRLAKKHMLLVNKRPILFYLIKRIEKEFEAEIAKKRALIVITTSDEPENDMFEQFANDSTVVFKGAINNIPLRHLQAVKEYSLDSVISIDGDDILCSVKGMKAVYDALCDENDYVKTVDMPLGMNSCGYSKDFLKMSLKGNSENVLETGWGHIFESAQPEIIHFPHIANSDNLRFTLDYDEDYNFFKKIIETYGDDIIITKDNELVDYVIENKIYKINEGASEKYWKNFYDLQNKER